MLQRITFPARARGCAENLVLTDFLAWSWSKPRRPGIMHWRTREQVEVDSVIHFPDGALLPIDVKSDRRPSFRDAAGLRLFLDEYSETRGELVLHVGTETYLLGEHLVATPWWRVLRRTSRDVRQRAERAPWPDADCPGVRPGRPDGSCGSTSGSTRPGTRS